MNGSIRKTYISIVATIFFAAHCFAQVKKYDFQPASGPVMVGYTAVTAADAVQYLDEATASLYQYDELDSLLERAPFYNNPPVESDEYVTYQQWIDQWQEIKASA